jgi:hypothetical protein
VNGLPGLGGRLGACGTRVAKYDDRWDGVAVRVASVVVDVHDAVSSAISCCSGSTEDEVHGEMSTGRKGGGGKATVSDAEGAGGGE